jgi:hypothetical protein
VDNRAAISWVNQTQHKNSRRWWYSDDINIVTMIMETMEESTLLHWLRWVKAHQARWQEAVQGPWHVGSNELQRQWIGRKV